MTFDPEFGSPADHARELRRHGLQAVPAMPPNGTTQWKRPSIKWREHEHALAPEDVFSGWSWGTNIGIITGSASGHVVVIDLDTHKGPAAMQWWHGVLHIHNSGMEPETVEQITGGGGRQLLFRYPATWQAPTCKFPTFSVDVRGQGGFIVCAPSAHTDGEYRWVDDRAPWETDIADIPQWLMDEIDALTALYGGRAAQTPTDDLYAAKVSITRLDAPAVPTTISGRLLDGRESYMAALVWATIVDLYELSPIRGSSQTFDVQCGEAYDTYANRVASRLDQSIPRDTALEAEGRGQTLFRQKWLYALNSWDTTVRQAAEARKTQPRRIEVEYHDPDTGEIIEPIEGDLPPPKVNVAHNVFDPWDQVPVPEFPLDTLPYKIQDFISVTAKSTGGDINAVAMAALVTAATAIDQSYRLKMKRSGSWRVPPRLWVMLVGDPSSKKSPIMNSCMAPIIEVERELGRQYAADIAKWKDIGKDIGEPEPDKPRRYTANSITIESVGVILARQDSGLTVINDELGSWIGTLDNAKGKGDVDKGFWASSFNGDFYRSDRIGRGETTVNNLLVNMLGGVQPALMQKLNGLTDNGLLQRFLPVIMKQGNPSAEIDDYALVAWDTTIRRLSAYTGCTMQATDEAMEQFVSFEARVNELQRMSSLGSQFCTFVGKLQGLQGSLALILHLIAGEWDAPVSGAAVQASTRILEEFCIPHALAFYGASSDAGDWESLRAIASYIITSDKDRFTPSDFMSQVRALRGLSAWDIGQRISPMVAAGWLDEDRPKGASLKGWVMVEGVREVLAVRREEQIRRRREAFEIVAQIGKTAKS